MTQRVVASGHLHHSILCLTRYMKQLLIDRPTQTTSPSQVIVT
jgi:hypothetical protein